MIVRESEDEIIMVSQNDHAQRQHRIITELNLAHHEDINKQFRLLQLCDVISLADAYKKSKWVNQDIIFVGNS